jgi:hypothetical protein
MDDYLASLRDLDVINETLMDAKAEDSGFNVINQRDSRGGKTKKMEMYTSSGTGNFIRDAETGEYYNEKVGSKDEDLYFKISLSTGECTSKNNSSAMYFQSPAHYMLCMKTTVSPATIARWEARRDARIAELKKGKPTVRGSQIVVIE